MSEAGKGSRYRPVNQLVYDSEYTRIFGKPCTACGGKGYYYDTAFRKMVKTTCILCNGTGRAKV